MCVLIFSKRTCRLSVTRTAAHQNFFGVTRRCFLVNNGITRIHPFFCLFKQKQRQNKFVREFAELTALPFPSIVCAHTHTKTHNKKMNCVKFVFVVFVVGSWTPHIDAESILRAINTIVQNDGGTGESVNNYATAAFTEFSKPGGETLVLDLDTTLGEFEMTVTALPERLVFMLKDVEVLPELSKVATYKSCEGKSSFHADAEFHHLSDKQWSVQSEVVTPDIHTAGGTLENEYDATKIVSAELSSGYQNATNSSTGMSVGPTNRRRMLSSGESKHAVHKRAVHHHLARNVHHVPQEHRTPQITRLQYLESQDEFHPDASANLDNETSRRSLAQFGQTDQSVLESSKLDVLHERLYERKMQRRGHAAEIIRKAWGKFEQSPLSREEWQRVAEQSQRARARKEARLQALGIGISSNLGTEASETRGRLINKRGDGGGGIGQSSDQPTESTYTEHPRGGQRRLLQTTTVPIGDFTRPAPTIISAPDQRASCIPMQHKYATTLNSTFASITVDQETGWNPLPQGQSFNQIAKPLFNGKFPNMQLNFDDALTQVNPATGDTGTTPHSSDGGVEVYVRQDAQGNFLKHNSLTDTTITPELDGDISVLPRGATCVFSDRNKNDTTRPADTAAIQCLPLCHDKQTDQFYSCMDLETARKESSIPDAKYFAQNTLPFAAHWFNDNNGVGRAWGKGGPADIGAWNANGGGFYADTSFHPVGLSTDRGYGGIGGCPCKARNDPIKRTCSLNPWVEPDTAGVLQSCQRIDGHWQCAEMRHRALERYLGARNTFAACNEYSTGERIGRGVAGVAIAASFWVNPLILAGVAIGTELDGDGFEDFYVGLFNDECKPNSPRVTWDDNTYTVQADMDSVLNLLADAETLSSSLNDLIDLSTQQKGIAASQLREAINQTVLVATQFDNALQLQKSSKDVEKLFESVFAEKAVLEQDMNQASDAVLRDLGAVVAAANQIAQDLADGSANDARITQLEQLLHINVDRQKTLMHRTDALRVRIDQSMQVGRSLLEMVRKHRVGTTRYASITKNVHSMLGRLNGQFGLRPFTSEANHEAGVYGVAPRRLTRNQRKVAIDTHMVWYVEAVGDQATVPQSVAETRQRLGLGGPPLPIPTASAVVHQYSFTLVCSANFLLSMEVPEFNLGSFRSNIGPSSCLLGSAQRQRQCDCRIHVEHSFCVSINQPETVASALSGEKIVNQDLDDPDRAWQGFDPRSKLDPSHMTSLCSVDPGAWPFLYSVQGNNTLLQHNAPNSAQPGAQPLEPVLEWDGSAWVGASSVDPDAPLDAPVPFDLGTAQQLDSFLSGVCRGRSGLNSDIVLLRNDTERYPRGRTRGALAKFSESFGSLISSTNTSRNGNLPAGTGNDTTAHPPTLFATDNEDGKKLAQELLETQFWESGGDASTNASTSQAAEHVARFSAELATNPNVNASSPLANITNDQTLGTAHFQDETRRLFAAVDETSPFFMVTGRRSREVAFSDATTRAKCLTREVDIRNQILELMQQLGESDPGFANVDPVSDATAGGGSKRTVIHVVYDQMMRSLENIFVSAYLDELRLHTQGVLPFHGILQTQTMVSSGSENAVAREDAYQAQINASLAQGGSGMIDGSADPRNPGPSKTPNPFGIEEDPSLQNADPLDIFDPIHGLEASRQGNASDPTYALEPLVYPGSNITVDRPEEQPKRVQDGADRFVHGMNRDLTQEGAAASLKRKQGRVNCIDFTVLATSAHAVPGRRATFVRAENQVRVTLKPKNGSRLLNATSGGVFGNSSFSWIEQLLQQFDLEQLLESNDIATQVSLRLSQRASNRGDVGGADFQNNADLVSSLISNANKLQEGDVASSDALVDPQFPIVGYLSCIVDPRGCVVPSVLDAAGAGRGALDNGDPASSPLTRTNYVYDLGAESIGDEFDMFELRGKSNYLRKLLPQTLTEQDWIDGKRRVTSSDVEGWGPARRKVPARFYDGWFPGADGVNHKLPMFRLEDHHEQQFGLDWIEGGGTNEDGFQVHTLARDPRKNFDPREAANAPISDRLVKLIKINPDPGTLDGNASGLDSTGPVWRCDGDRAAFGFMCNLLQEFRIVTDPAVHGGQTNPDEWRELVLERTKPLGSDRHQSTTLAKQSSAVKEVVIEVPPFEVLEMARSISPCSTSHSLGICDLSKGHGCFANTSSAGDPDDTNQLEEVLEWRVPPLLEPNEPQRTVIVQIWYKSSVQQSGACESLVTGGVICPTASHPCLVVANDTINFGEAGFSNLEGTTSLVWAFDVSDSVVADSAFGRSFSLALGACHPSHVRVLRRFSSAPLPVPPATVFESDEACWLWERSQELASTSSGRVPGTAEEIAAISSEVSKEYSAWQHVQLNSVMTTVGSETVFQSDLMAEALASLLEETPSFTQVSPSVSGYGTFWKRYDPLTANWTSQTAIPRPNASVLPPPGNDTLTAAALLAYYNSYREQSNQTRQRYARAVESMYGEKEELKQYLTEQLAILTDAYRRATETNEALAQATVIAAMQNAMFWRNATLWAETNAQINATLTDYSFVAPSIDVLGDFDASNISDDAWEVLALLAIQVQDDSDYADTYKRLNDQATQLLAERDITCQVTSNPGSWLNDLCTYKIGEGGDELKLILWILIWNVPVIVGILICVYACPRTKMIRLMRGEFSHKMIPPEKPVAQPVKGKVTSSKRSKYKSVKTKRSGFPKRPKTVREMQRHTFA